MFDVETLMFEVFEKEERCEAELRMTPAEAAALETVGASCKPFTHEDAAGKRWYFVTLPDG